MAPLLHLCVCSSPLLGVGRLFVLTEGDTEHREAQEQIGDAEAGPDQTQLDRKSVV